LWPAPPWRSNSNSPTSLWVAEVVNSLAEVNLLRIRNEVAEPGPDGWGFIESQQIYSNIASSFSKVALVDVDTGKRLADVGGLEAGAGGVQIGGRSYEVVGSRAGRVRVVRGSAGEQPAPTYAARSLPYAADIGMALAGRFGIDGSELLVLDLGDRVAAFTWLGRLQNLCLEGLLGQKGVQAKAMSFSVHLRGVQPCDCLKKLTAAALDGPLENPLPNLRVENVVDLGPHFELLTEEQQRSARGDWFEAEPLRGSVSKLARVRLVEREGSLGKELAGLAGI